MKNIFLICALVCTLCVSAQHKLYLSECCLYEIAAQFNGDDEILVTAMVYGTPLPEIKSVGLNWNYQPTAKPDTNGLLYGFLAQSHLDDATYDSIKVWATWTPTNFEDCHIIGMSGVASTDIKLAKNEGILHIRMKLTKVQAAYLKQVQAQGQMKNIGLSLEG